MGPKWVATSAQGERLSLVLELQLYLHPLSLDFLQVSDKLMVPQETNKSIPSPKKNYQGKIFKILLEGLLLISELACPHVELLGDLNSCR